MLDLSRATTEWWLSLLPKDFKKIAGNEASIESSQIDSITEMLNHSPPGQEIEAFRRISTLLTRVTRCERLRIICWFASRLTHQKYLELLVTIEGIAKNGDNESQAGAREMLNILNETSEAVRRRLAAKN